MIGIAPPVSLEENMTLSDRLQRIADYVRPGERVIDVGTDHAYIPIWLLLNGFADSVVATDLREGPLLRARADAERCGVAERLILRRCDGLSDCEPDSVDTIILAGMGGETIIGILSAAPWAREKRLILQAQTKQDRLRKWLSENGYRILDASLAEDMGRIYLIWLVITGDMPERCAVDRALLDKRDPLLKPYLNDRMKRLRKQINGVSMATRPDTQQLAALTEELNQLESISREAEAWQA